ncbi:hypothetical protein VIM7927_02140 [Vibrio mangrovi]|uniref:Uncharacterized protein n=1 Tax=Vibrio mangrovi TaxID=474394 RepID=A0A1Y6IT69_9VIBR|nr:hypothetical protein VIM7927_02140 [Vibrio mangrovi]
MSLSEIIVPQISVVPTEDQRQDKLRKAYIASRKACSLTDIELNRSRVLVIDEHGRVVKCAFAVEH